MKYPIIIILVISILAMSCFFKKEIIVYEYNGVVITRIDKNAESYFYYGKYELNNLPNSFIKAKYSGLDGLMGAYLLFEKNENVKLIRCYGLFSSEGNYANSKLQLIESDDVMQQFDYKKIKKNKNVIYLSDGIKYEKEENFKNHSNVNATYELLPN